MLNVIMLSVVMLSVIMLSVIILSVVLLSVIMMSVIMSSAIMLNVMVPQNDRNNKNASSCPFKPNCRGSRFLGRNKLEEKCLF